MLEKRHAVLRKPEVQYEVLKEEVELIVEEANEEWIEGLSRHMKTHAINSNEVTAEEMLKWARIVRVFKSISRKSECQDMRNILNVIVN